MAETLGTVVEVPITFSERELGVSKMSGSNNREALLKVTRWGVQGRLNRLMPEPMSMPNPLIGGAGPIGRGGGAHNCVARPAVDLMPAISFGGPERASTYDQKSLSNSQTGRWPP